MNSGTLPTVSLVKIKGQQQRPGEKQAEADDIGREHGPALPRRLTFGTFAKIDPLAHHRHCQRAGDDHHRREQPRQRVAVGAEDGPHRREDAHVPQQQHQRQHPDCQRDLFQPGPQVIGFIQPPGHPVDGVGQDQPPGPLHIEQQRLGHRVEADKHAPLTEQQEAAQGHNHEIEGHRGVAPAVFLLEQLDAAIQRHRRRNQRDQTHKHLHRAAQIVKKADAGL